MSSDFMFATFQNAGIRVFDIPDEYHPVDVAAFVPPAPRTLVDPRSGRKRVIQPRDVLVDEEALVYSTDYNGGLYLLECNI